MDIEEFIEINAPHSPTLSNTPHLLHFHLDYHIEESEQFPESDIHHVFPNLSNIVNILKDSDEFTTMPTDDLIKISILKHGLHKEQANELTALIKKYKNIEKRNKAKRRKFGCQPQTYQPPNHTLLTEELLFENQNPTVETEIKKQRNRMSAQISRDRKKIYVKTLETENKELINEAEMLRIENEKLKQVILDKENPHKNNKFMRLLVLLGIIFFVCLVKDALGFKNNKSNKINNSKIGKFGNGEKVENLNSNGFMEEIEREIRNENCEEIESLDEQKENNQKGGLKEAILTQIASLNKKNKDCILPSTIFSLLEEAKTITTF